MMMRKEKFTEVMDKHTDKHREGREAIPAPKKKMPPPPDRRGTIGSQLAAVRTA